MSLTDEERAARKIGGSMIAKIVKKSKWGTPLDAYLELTGERPSVEKTGEDIDRGNFLEPSLLKWASKKIGRSFRKPQFGSKLKEWDWATVSPDGICIDDQLAGLVPGEVREIEHADDLLEIKAPRRNDILSWGEEHSDEVPTDALLQTHWGVMVTNADRGWVAALLGGELKIFKIERDLDLEAKLLTAAKRFVEEHVIPRVPPPAEFGDDANVLYLHPRNSSPHRDWADLSEQEKFVVEAYLAAYKAESLAAKSLEGWEPAAKSIVGDAAGINLPAELGRRIDWKNNATAGTKWKQLAEHLLLKLPITEVQALTEQFKGEPSRVFRPWLNAAKKEK